MLSASTESRQNPHHYTCEPARTRDAGPELRAPFFDQVFDVLVIKAHRLADLCAAHREPRALAWSRVLAL